MGDRYSVSYLTLRKMIGILGILLPTVCVAFGMLFGGLELQGSISAYYHTNVRDFFVGLLVCVGLFMSTYGGYDKIDRAVSWILSISAVGIALFPCRLDPTIWDKVSIFQLNPAVSNMIHLISAGTFFLTLAFNSFFLFTKTTPNKPMTSEKEKRNLIYRICGIVIFACCILDVIYVKFVSGDNGAIVFFETIMLYAFGTSWLVKGETILKDKVIVTESKFPL
jgi:uncharacterized membrane protein YwaF